MGIKLSQGDKILSMVNSGLGILVIIVTHIFKPDFFHYAVIVAVVLIALTIIILVIKIAIQSKRIHIQEDKIQKLEDNQRLIKQDLTKKEERIALLEQLLAVPFFKKWHLFYTFIWRNAISFMNNPVNLYEIHVIRKLIGNGRIKDNNVTYIFSGEADENLRSFRFCIAGAGNVPLEKIQFHVKDLTLNEELDYSVLKNTQDANIKYIEVYFRRPMSIGDCFKIEFHWQWPKTAYIKSDYFSIPNIYSRATKRIVLDLYPTTDMKLSLVETYKFGLDDAEPLQIEHLYGNPDGLYRSIIDSPEMNADYITYYG